jgi:hypothetical protein
MSSVPFSHIRKVEPLLPRAEKRLGRAVASLSPAEKKQAFYSYFSEIGDDNYELAMRL